jgi:signal transduction histidine kinase
LVAAHGGTIIARSADAGPGNTFIVTLPRTGQTSTSGN